MGRGPSQAYVLRQAINILYAGFRESDDPQQVDIADEAQEAEDRETYPLKAMKAAYNILRKGALIHGRVELLSEADAQLNLNSTIRRNLERNCGRFRL